MLHIFSKGIHKISTRILWRSKLNTLNIEGIKFDKIKKSQKNGSKPNRLR